MKQTTKDWLTKADEDLLAAKKLADDERLSHLASFHCQQCTEKCFKAIIEERDLPFIKSHDLVRLQSLSGVQLSEEEILLLEQLNEVYLDSRYPGDLGLVPHGKPTNQEIFIWIEFCKTLLAKVNYRLQRMTE